MTQPPYGQDGQWVRIVAVENPAMPLRPKFYRYL